VVGTNAPKNTAIGFALIFVAICMSLFTGVIANLAVFLLIPSAGLLVALVLILATAGCAWLAWKHSPSSRKMSSLFAGIQYALLFPLFMAFSLGGGMLSPETSMQQVLFSYALALAVLSLAYERWKIRNPNLEKPAPAGSSSASYVIYTYGTPIWVYASIFLGLGIFTALLSYLYPEFLRIYGTSRQNSPTSISLLPFAWMLASIFIGLYARSHLRSKYLDTPYIWLTSSSLNVRNRMAIDWSKITRIEFHWRRTRSGMFKSGLDVYSNSFPCGEYVTLSFYNATTEPEEAMAALKAVPQAQNISFEDLEIEIREKALKRFNAKIGQRMLRKNPTMKLETEARIAEVQDRIAKLDTLIEEAKTSLGTIREVLVKSRDMVGWSMKGRVLSPSRIWPDNIDFIALSPTDRASWHKDRTILQHLSLEKKFEDFPDRIAALERSKQALLDDRQRDQKLFDCYFG
jgi:hypothetical protein